MEKQFTVIIDKDGIRLENVLGFHSPLEILGLLELAKTVVLNPDKEVKIDE